MASTGEKFATTATDVSEAPWSDDAWTSVANAQGANNSTFTTITAATYDSGDQSHVLKLAGYDMSSIPVGSTIDGVIVRVYGAAEMAGAGAIGLVQLLDTSGAKVGTNQASTEVAVTTTPTTYTFGTSSDLWGNALTRAWVQDPDFGVAIGFWARAANTDVEFDAVSIEVFYTAPTPKQTSTAEISLAPGSTPSVQTNHKIKLRARKTANTGTIRARLYEGATARSAELETSELTTSFADYTLDIADADAANITDYSNLSIRLYGYSAAGDATVFEVSQLYLETPASSVAAYTLDAQPGSFAVSGAAMSPLAARTLNASPGSYAITGVAAGLSIGYSLNAQPGSYAITGSPASPLADRVISASPGSYAVAGADAGFARTLIFAVDPGSYAVTGADAGVVAGRAIAADPGSYAITGAVADLLYVPVGAYVLSADPGSFSVDGAPAGALADRQVDAQPGSFAVAGADAGVLADRMLVAAPGVYTVDGVAAFFDYSAAPPAATARSRTLTGMGT